MARYVKWESEQAEPRHAVQDRDAKQDQPDKDHQPVPEPKAHAEPRAQKAATNAENNGHDAKPTYGVIDREKEAQEKRSMRGSSDVAIAGQGSQPNDGDEHYDDRRKVTSDGASKRPDNGTLPVVHSVAPKWAERPLLRFRAF
jgi:hypothetical protein